MSSKNKGLITLCIPLLVLLITFSGCETPGDVGSGLINNSKLVFDTLSVSGIQELEYKGYSGQTTFLPIGKYSDPVFGDVDVQALIKPTLQNVSVDSGGSINNNHSMKLVLSFDSTNVYGDTLSEASFSVYEVTSPWRGTNWKIDDQVTYDETNPVGSFSYTDEDTVIVDLADNWKDKYAAYFNDDSTANIDSLYAYQFHGLVIIPDENTSKIKFPQIGPTRFWIINDVDEDTSLVSANDWAYSLTRGGNTNFLENTTPLHNTLEAVFKLDTTALSLEYFKDGDFVSASLVFHEAKEYMTQNLPLDNVRPDVNNLNMDVGYGLDLLYDLQFGTQEFTAFKTDSSRNVFVFDITNLINNYLYGSLDENELFIGIGPASGQPRSTFTGLLKSTLIYNENAPEHLKPELVVTSVREEEE